jgi:hypothetical protein
VPKKKVSAPSALTVGAVNECRRLQSEVPPSLPKEEYAFPSRVRCERCGSPNSKVYGTKGATQYRECQVAVCRWRFKTPGKSL